MAAAYLARAGKTVLVLERRDHVGGAAVSERPWEGVDARLSRYSYLVSLLPRAVREELGLTIELRRRSVSSYSPRLDGSGLLVRTGAPLNWPAFEAMTARVAEAVFPTLTQPLVSRDELRARVGDDAAWEALVERPLGEVLDALLRGRLRARDHRHRRADRHLRRARRRVAAPEPLLPLPRDRQRHGRLGRAGGRHGRADRGAGGDRVRRRGGAAARLRGDRDRDRRRRRRGALRGRLGERAPRARERRSGRARAAARRARARPAARGRPAQAQPAAEAAAAAARSRRSIRSRPSRARSTSTSPRPSSRSPTRRPTGAWCPSWRRARSTATRSPIPSILGPELREAGAQTLTCFGLHMPARIFAGDRHQEAKAEAIASTLRSLEQRAGRADRGLPVDRALGRAVPGGAHAGRARGRAGPAGREHLPPRPGVAVRGGGVRGRDVGRRDRRSTTC